MERNAHYLIVGSFVAIALTLGAIMFLWIAGTYSGEETYKRYSIYFKGSVSGLSEGSNVSYRGVGVGRVLSIQFDPKHPEKIKTIIEVAENTPISTSSVVSIQAVGITGLSALAIKTANAEGGALEVEEDEKYPIIPSELSEVSQLLSDAPQITDNAIETLVRINRLLSEKNLANIEKSIENISLASSKANSFLDNSNIEDINKSIENMALASAKLNNFLDDKKLKNIDKSIQNMTKASSQVSSVLNSENVSNVAAIINNINSTTARMDNLLAKNEKQMEHFTGSNLDEISVLVKETQDMVNSFKLLAQKLSDDPSQIIYKPNYEGVKVKQ